MVQNTCSSSPLKETEAQESYKLLREEKICRVQHAKVNLRA